MSVGPRSPTGGAQFPISAVVGQDELRLALLLAAIDPRIGGVLLRGEKGSAKTTMARGLASVLPGEAPFVEIPLGATEDRVVGSVDLRAALLEGERRFAPGLLAEADGGVLYVDEVNLLPDHLVDVLLDVAVSGINRVEREGVSHSHPSRFVLLGSMNPEEGELRPQLLDRFGLAVHVVAPIDPASRAEAVRRRLELEADPVGFSERWSPEEEKLRDRLASARPAPLADGLLELVSSVCAAAGAEGLRADLVCCRAAAALAGFEGAPEADAGHVRRVAPMALAHRTRRGPFDSPVFDSEELEDALDRALRPEQAQRTRPAKLTGDAPSAPEPSATSDAQAKTVGSKAGSESDEPGGDGGYEDPIPAHAAPHARPPHLEASARFGVTSGGNPDIQAPGRRTAVLSDRGRLVGAKPSEGSLRSIALMPTIDAAASRIATRPRAGAEAATSPTFIVEEGDLREAVREQRAANLVVLVVDASGSMGVEGRIAAAKGAVVSLLVNAYERRDRVALVAFREDNAQVALRPTGSVEVARARLEELRTGGRTPLAAGIETALELSLVATRGAHKPLIVLVSDGRATYGPEGVDPFRAALDAAGKVRRMRVPAVVIDAEDGTLRLGLAGAVAREMGARLVTAGALTADGLASTVRGLLPSD